MRYKSHQRISTVSKAGLPLLTKVHVIQTHVGLLPKTGGFSLNLNLQEPQSGYMVGGYSDVYANPTDDQIEALLKKATGNFFVGGWIDENTDKVYIELSKRFDDKETAIKTARFLKELAVYDVENKKTIYL